MTFILAPTNIYIIALENFCFLKSISTFLLFPLFLYFSKWFIGLTLTIVTFYIIFLMLKSKNKNFINNYSEFAPKEEQYNMYLLFFGIAVPIVEIILEIFHIRSTSQLLLKSLFGIALLGVYFINTKTNLLKNSFKPIFILIYLSFFVFNLYNIIYHQFELFVYVGLIVNLFISYYIFKNLIQYLVFISIIFLITLSLNEQNILSTNLIVVLIFLLNFSSQLVC
jgi:hypothetical protein